MIILNIIIVLGIILAFAIGVFLYQNFPDNEKLEKIQDKVADFYLVYLFALIVVVIVYHVVAISVHKKHKQPKVDAYNSSTFYTQNSTPQGDVFITQKS